MITTSQRPVSAGAPVQMPWGGGRNAFVADRRGRLEAENMSGEVVGRVFAYFKNVNVAAIELSASLSVGDRIRITGATTDIEMTVDSMQIDRVTIESATAGQSVGLAVPERVRPNDQVITA
jgi:putative protease